MRAGVFAGTFDPIHSGHFFVIKRALQFLEHLFIVVADNSEKKTFFTLEERIALVQECLQGLEGEDKFRASTHYMASGLLVKQARQLGAKFLIRGIRNPADYTYEMNMADVNLSQSPEVATLLIPTTPDLACVSSSVVKELLLKNGDIQKFVPGPVHSKITQIISLRNAH